MQQVRPMQKRESLPAEDAVQEPAPRQVQHQEVRQEMRQEQEPRPGRLAIYHANSKGTGAAMRLEFKVHRGADSSGCFFLEMAKQRSVASRGEQGRTHATFAWDSKVTVKLGFTDICELLMVLDGRKEQAGSERGLFHSSGQANTVIVLKKSADYGGGYLLGLSKKDNAGAQLFKEHIILSETEALGLRCIFQSSLFPMVFAAG